MAFPSDEVSIVGVSDRDVLSSSKTLFVYEVEVLSVDGTFALFGWLVRSSIEIWVPIPNADQYDEPELWVSTSDKLRNALNFGSYMVVEIVLTC